MKASEERTLMEKGFIDVDKKSLQGVFPTWSRTVYQHHIMPRERLRLLLVELGVTIESDEEAGEELYSLSKDHESKRLGQQLIC